MYFYDYVFFNIYCILELFYKNIEDYEISFSLYELYWVRLDNVCYL